jgi:hypothetical protein
MLVSREGQGFQVLAVDAQVQGGVDPQRQRASGPPRLRVASATPV